MNKEDDKDYFEEAKREVKKQLSSEEIKKEIKENYKIGIEYYEDVEEHQE